MTTENPDRFDLIELDRPAPRAAVPATVRQPIPVIAAPAPAPRVETVVRAPAAMQPAPLYCECPIGTRPSVAADGKCPTCSKARRQRGSYGNTPPAVAPTANAANALGIPTNTNPTPAREILTPRETVLREMHELLRQGRAASAVVSVDGPRVAVKCECGKELVLRCVDIWYETPKHKRRVSCGCEPTCYEQFQMALAEPEPVTRRENIVITDPKIHTSISLPYEMFQWASAKGNVSAVVRELMAEAMKREQPAYTRQECKHEWSVDEQNVPRCIGCGEPR